MIKSVMPKLRENKILTFITQQRCNSLCNHGLLIIIITFFQDDNIFGIVASLTYGPQLL